MNDKLTREFKKNLERILKKKKGALSAKRLSINAGLGETAVRDILQHYSVSPKLETVYKIANALDMDVYELMPSLIGDSIKEIENLRSENHALREALDNTYASMENNIKAAKERSQKMSAAKKKKKK